MSLYPEVASCSVAEVMGTELFTLTPETAVASARRLVLENDVHHMLVLDNGTLAGIVCRDDLRFADRNARIADCMTSPVLCITPDTTLQEAVDIMGANDIDCLPVVTGTFLIGIVTLEGLATAEWSPVREQRRQNRRQGAQQDAPEDALENTRESRWEEPSSDSCGACSSMDEVECVASTGDFALCGRCRHLIATNQRC